MQPANGWTEERSAEATRLFLDGFTGSQIARQLGGGLTRNAVIGKLHRLGVCSPMTKARAISQGRMDPASRKPAREPNRGTVRSPDKALPVFEIPAEEPPAATDAQGACFTILTIPSRGLCKWPHGDPQSDSFHFCARSVSPGSNYCRHHHRRAHLPGPAKAA